MLKEIKNAIVTFFALTIITGIVYPLIVTLAAQAMFNDRANGSMLPANNGSTLIGQSFDDPKYFWSRLSGCGYNAAASSGTNYSMSNPALIDSAKTRVDVLKSADPSNQTAIPVDLVTASGSGLDPHISVASARYQASRVARSRDKSIEDIHRAIDHCTENSMLGLLGDPAVNIVRLNLLLDGKLAEHSNSAFGWKSKAFEPN